jgi:hypothetical protein
MAKAALVSNPLNNRNKDLLNELKSRISELTAASQRATVVQIRCIERSSQASPHACIQSVGGVNSDGKRWKIAISDAVSHIQNGKYKFFIERPAGHRLDIVVAQDASGRKYLKAASDTEEPSHLLDLPSCP